MKNSILIFVLILVSSCAPKKNTRSSIPVTSDFTKQSSNVILDSLKLVGTEFNTGWFDSRYMNSFNRKLGKYYGYIRYNCVENDALTFSAEDCDCFIFYSSTDSISSDSSTRVLFHDMTGNTYPGVLYQKNDVTIIKDATDFPIMPCQRWETLDDGCELTSDMLLKKINEDIIFIIKPSTRKFANNTYSSEFEGEVNYGESFELLSMEGVWIELRDLDNKEIFWLPSPHILL